MMSGFFRSTCALENFEIIFPIALSNSVTSDRSDVKLITLHAKLFEFCNNEKLSSSKNKFDNFFKT